VIVRGDLTEVGVSAVDVAVEYAAASVGVKTAVSEYEATPVGIHGQAAVYGEARVVATLSHPAISVPLLLKATVPGAEVVAVIVSTDPYVGVAVLSARLFVVVILATLIVTAVVVPSESVDNLYGVQLDFVSYRSGSDGTQSYVRLVEAAVDGVQVQVVVHGDSMTDLLVQPEISCPAALKEIVPGI
jgi:hypothetical protein